ncbi:multicopper oxidase family protein [Streptosporangium roseum]|uniref:multicopper oxidase family protein n=1 Tax=Streptosporangium roseum TaxID=2001 RepID=UPI00332E33FD
MNLTRRHVLRLLGASAVAVPAAGLLVAAARDRVDTVGRVAFTNRLQAPPLAPSRLDSAGRRVFDLRIRAGQREFVSDRPSSTWGVDSDYLGPTLRARRGERVLANVANEVEETTTLHWHGMHLPPEMDGGPYQPIEPGAAWSPTWRIRLRLLNGSNARVYDFAFADGRPFAQIASDGGLLSTPHGTRHVQLAPGERAEIVVALTPGERVVLRSASPADTRHTTEPADLTSEGRTTRAGRISHRIRRRRKW